MFNVIIRIKNEIVRSHCALGPHTRTQNGKQCSRIGAAAGQLNPDSRYRANIHSGRVSNNSPGRISSHRGENNVHTNTHTSTIFENKCIQFSHQTNRHTHTNQLHAQGFRQPSRKNLELMMMMGIISALAFALSFRKNNIHSRSRSTHSAYSIVYTASPAPFVFVRVHIPNKRITEN